MNSPSPLLAVVLAAGDSRRFGSDKRFAKTASGVSLIQATLDLLGNHLTEIYVAIRPQDVIDEGWPSLASGVPVNYLRAPRAALGMGCTLADATRQTPLDRDVLVALADMPFLRDDTLARLVRRYRQSSKTAPIVFPVYVPPAKAEEASPIHAGRRGHPVIFHRSYRSRLENLQGDTGANAIIADHIDAHEVLEVQDPGVLWDVDQPQDLGE